MTQGYYPPPPPPDQQYDPMLSPALAKGLAITSLVTGIVALVLSWIPIVGLLVGAVAVITGIMALRKAQPKGMSISGIATGALGMLASVILTVVVGVMISNNQFGPFDLNVSPSPTSSPKAMDSPTHPEPEAADGTANQQNALSSAESHLSFSTFSRASLIAQLESEGFSTSDAENAVDTLTVDWNQQAAASAENYLDFLDFSRSELIDQLLHDGFTQEQAEFGVNQTGL